MKNTDYIWWYNLFAVYTNLYFIIFHFSLFIYHFFIPFLSSNASIVGSPPRNRL